MAISKETEKWLTGLESEGKLPKEVITQLRAAAEASTDSDNYIKGSVLRQDDYSRNISEVKAAQKVVEDSQRALKEKEDAVTRYQAELGTWKAGADTNYNKALQEREAAETRSARAVAKLKTLATASGFSEEDVLKDLDLPVNDPKPNTAPTFDTSKFVTLDQMNSVTSQAAMLDATIHDISVQHQDLFGGRINAKALVEAALKSGKSLETYWKETYKVDEKLKEKEEASIQARIDTAVQERETSLRSQLSIPAPRAGRDTNPYTSRPLFDNPAIKSQAESQFANSGGVSAAIAAHNAGKYAQKYNQ